jgi:ParB-like chromosome segregation protein Spo0J
MTESNEINDGAFIVNDDLDIHPDALILPLMNPEEFRKFKEDIRVNGLVDPIILFQGKILDGRNRYNACMEPGIDVWARNWKGGMHPAEYVLSKNYHRRHLELSEQDRAVPREIKIYPVWG